MRNLLKSEKGITLIYLATAVIVLIIITNVILYSLKDNLQVEQLRNMQNDISNLRDKVTSYYAQYGEIPANKNIEYDITGRDIQTSGIISTAVDTGKFYVIDLKAIENLSLNYGKDYEKYKQIVGNNTEITDDMKNQVNQLTDIYIINGDSNNIFYVQGVDINGEYFYTDYSVEDVDKVPVSLVDIPEQTKDDLSEFQTADTKPYLPGDDFSHVEGTDLTTGLVITDGTNYWTWVEVPKSIYENTTYNKGTAPAGEEDYDIIEKVLSNYTGTLLSRDEYVDKWYDGQGRTEEESDTTEDTTGCGLTASQYKDLKQTMLSSVYKNGGFWIGQYEVGADAYPATDENDSRTPIISQGKYPYNYITCANAQIKSSQINSGDYTSSLMFGIQWDLVLKHLEIKAQWDEEQSAEYYLTTDSTSWGNYNNATFTIENGQYTINTSDANSFIDYNIPTEDYVDSNGIKLEDERVLYTTGASSQNRKMNIYDIAGNIYEWTLEKGYRDEYPCVSRGGYYYRTGDYSPAAYRNYDDKITSYYNIGFRPTIY